MKLAAIYNVWDGDELLRSSINSIIPYVDLIIIVWQDISNFGEHYTPSMDGNFYLEEGMGCIATLTTQEEPDKIFHAVEYVFQKYIPTVIDGAINETNKRNIGLEIAKNKEATHFIFMDCDELYEDFGKGKKDFIESGANGSVCRLFTYWGKPTYQLYPKEDYWVPFIHKLTEKTVAGMQIYPFWCDPTRRVNEQNVVELPILMHHFSYVRNNIERKLRNSSAKINLENSTYLQDYKDLMATTTPNGHYIPCMQRKVKIVNNIFNIPE